MTFDAIVVLGGGMRAGGVLPVWVQHRLDLAIDRWRGEYILPLSAYSLYRAPPLDEHGFPITEARVHAQYLIDRGIPPDRILIEDFSHDTVGNAYFARVIHTDVAQLRSLLVVTSEFHMRRSRSIFEWVFGMPPGGYRLEFAESSNDGMEEHILAARRRKERHALDKLSLVMPHVTDMRELHHWLFEEHGAYAPERNLHTLAPHVLDSY